MLASASFVLAAPTPKATSSPAPLLTGEPLNYSQVSDVKGIALTRGSQVNAGVVLLR